MSASDLKAKFEQDIKRATPKGKDTLRENIRTRGTIPNIGATGYSPSPRPPFTPSHCHLDRGHPIYPHAMGATHSTTTTTTTTTLPTDLIC